MHVAGQRGVDSDEVVQEAIIIIIRGMWESLSKVVMDFKSRRKFEIKEETVNKKLEFS